MKVASRLIKRNVKLFFMDKGMFFTALITPGILLMLYATFLSNVYRDSFLMSMPEGVIISDEVVDGLVCSQLVSSILAVSCVTVAFCSNFLIVQDRANGTVRDLRISPVSSSVLSLGYYLATLISTLIICITATIICLVYASFVGWYMSAVDVALIFADVVLLVFFGTALSSVINFFLTSQGQISAVGTIVSSGYGFICGAYMPISSFGEGLQKTVAFLPGTYGTSLLRNHTMRGVLEKMQSDGMPQEAISSFRDTLDCNIYFFDTSVEIPVMFMILGIAVAVLVGVYILLNSLAKNKK